MTVFFRFFRNRRRFIDVEAFRSTMRQGLENEVLPEIVQLHEDFTTDWTNKPEFVGTAKIERRGTTLEVVAKGPMANVWRALDQGVPQQKIYAKPGKPFPIKFGYKPKTMRFSGYVPKTLNVLPDGRDVIFRMSATVFVAKRDFSGRIVRYYQPIFLRKTENIARRASRAAQRSGQ
jgi:hypothetical protein